VYLTAKEAADAMNDLTSASANAIRANRSSILLVQLDCTNGGTTQRRLLEEEIGVSGYDASVDRTSFDVNTISDQQFEDIKKDMTEAVQDSLKNAKSVKENPENYPIITPVGADEITVPSCCAVLQLCFFYYAFCVNTPLLLSVSCCIEILSFHFFSQRSNASMSPRTRM
jgi:hypothetical protein